MSDKETLTPEQEKDIFNQFVGELNGTKQPDDLSDKKEEVTPVEKQPEPEPEKKEEVQSKETQPEKQEENNQPDPLEAFIATLPEEAREKVLELARERDEFKQREKRARGSVSYYHKNYSKTRQQLAELEQKLNSNPVPNQSQKLEKTQLPPKLQQLAETDPTIFEALSELDEKNRRERDQFFETQIKPIHQQRVVDQQLEITQALDTTIPNWRECLFELDENHELKTDEKGVPVFNEHWSRFLSQQPPQVQQTLMYPQSVEDAFWAFNQYGQWANAVRQQNQPIQRDQPQADDKRKADQIQQKRQQDLTKVPVKGVSVPMGNPQDDPNSDKWQKDTFAEALAFIKTGKSKVFK